MTLDADLAAFKMSRAMLQSLTCNPWSVSNGVSEVGWG